MQFRVPSTVLSQISPQIKTHPQESEVIRQLISLPPRFTTAAEKLMLQKPTPYSHCNFSPLSLALSWAVHWSAALEGMFIHLISPAQSWNEFPFAEMLLTGHNCNPFTCTNQSQEIFPFSYCLSGRLKMISGCQVTGEEGRR